MSKLGKSKHQLWHELCELIAKNPEKVILCVCVCCVCVCVQSWGSYFMKVIYYILLVTFTKK